MLVYEFRILFNFKGKLFIVVCVTATIKVVIIIIIIMAIKIIIIAIKDGLTSVAVTL
jgi:hypothetical protein